jgi:SAM-dependent methyltransferase
MSIERRKKSYYRQKADSLGWGFSSAVINPNLAGLIQKYTRGKRVLDVGCGSGIWTDFLSRRGFKVVGIDFVGEFIKQAQKEKKGRFILGKAEEIPFNDKSFDTVLLINLLEHVDDDLRVLKEAARVGKRILINVPQETPSFLVKRGVVYKHYLDRSHERVYTKRSLERLANRVGLRLVKVKEVERLPAVSLFYELFAGPAWLRRLVTKFFFLLFKEKNYYLELFAVAEK